MTAITPPPAPAPTPGRRRGDATTATRHGELLYRFEARLEIVPLGLVAEGIRMANPFEGRVTDGALAGARVQGVDHLVLRPDGVALVDVQKTVALGDRRWYEHVRGYGLPPDGLEVPPLPVLLDPAFRWPDVLFPVLAFTTFSTADPALAHLNRAIGRVDGWFSFATGRLAVETRLVRHDADVPGAAA